MTFQPPVRRIPTKFGHYYKDGAGQRIPGVTTILNGGMPKPFLIEWAGNKSAEICVDHFDELANMPATKKLEFIKNKRKTTENVAKNKGTAVHKIAEQVVQGLPAKFDTLEDEELLRPYIENYIRFIDVWKLDPILAEVVIVNYSIGYAGTLDLIAELTTPAGDRETWLLDLKTGEKGIWPETALQLAAYRKAERYLDNQGIEQAMLDIDIDKCAAIHVTADDAVLIPVTADDEAFRIFRFAQKLYQFDKDKDGYVLPAITHPALSNAKVDWK